MQKGYTEIIARLERVTAGSRILDGAIAIELGWRKLIKPHTEPSGHVTHIARWLVPGSDDLGRVPAYTSEIQAAYDLAQLLHPDHVGACSWDNDRGKAQVGLESSPVEAATPALALCIAALRQALIK